MGDVANGAKIFKTKCAQCHVVEKGAGHKQGDQLRMLYISTEICLSIKFYAMYACIYQGFILIIAIF